MPSCAYTACVRAVAVLLAACLCSATTVTAAPTAADALAALGLHVRSVDGQFEVTKVCAVKRLRCGLCAYRRQWRAQANSPSIRPGEVLVAADRDSISAQSFAQALQTRTSPFVLPVVRNCTRAVPCVSFVRL